MDLLQTDTFVSLSGDIDQLFHLYDRFPLFPEIKVMPVQPVINILLQRDHGILEKFGLYHLSLGYIDIIPFAITSRLCSEKRCSDSFKERETTEALAPEKRRDKKSKRVTRLSICVKFYAKVEVTLLSLMNI